jgi:hypothetical protein
MSALSCDGHLFSDRNGMVPVPGGRDACQIAAEGVLCEDVSESAK